MNPSNLSLRQKSRGTVVKTIAIHLYGARDPNYIVDLCWEAVALLTVNWVNIFMCSITCAQFLLIQHGEMYVNT